MEKFEKPTQKNKESVLADSEVRWKLESEIRSGDCTVHFSGSEGAEKGVDKIIARSVLRRLFVMTDTKNSKRYSQNNSETC